MEKLPRSYEDLTIFHANPCDSLKPIYNKIDSSSANPKGEFLRLPLPTVEERRGMRYVRDMTKRVVGQAGATLRSRP